MRASLLHLALSAALTARSVLALLPRPPVVRGFETDAEDVANILSRASNLDSSSTFTQYIDHDNPSFGTFPQTYYYNATFWNGTGSPVILLCPGEMPVSERLAYLGERSFWHEMAKELGAALLVVEHRYWGTSNPFPQHTTKNLQYLTVAQALADFARMPKELKLPFDPNGNNNAPDTPWIFVGTSYSGALAVWLDKIYPDTFWALHSSSGSTESFDDYWQYFVPVQKGMPQNCSSDFAAIVDHIDNVLIHGTAQQQADLKAMFGLQDLEHNDDVATAISYPMFLWQDIQFYDGYTQFYELCDAVEGGRSDSPGVGLEQALANYAKWFSGSYLPGYCSNTYGYPDFAGDNNVQCLNSYNASNPMYTDLASTNTFTRTFQWIKCNEPYTLYQTGGPTGRPTIFTRLSTVEYAQHQCSLYFPTEDGYTFGSNRGLTTDDFNAKYGGWYFTGNKRVMHVAGEFDPWRESTVLSDYRPGGPFQGTADTPAINIKTSRHGNDMSLRNGLLNPNVGAAQKVICAHFVQWINDFYAAHGRQQ